MGVGMSDVKFRLSSRAESNRHRRFRKPMFYPLNYERMKNLNVRPDGFEPSTPTLYPDFIGTNP